MAEKSERKHRQKTSKSESGWPVRFAMCMSAVRKQDECVFQRSPGFVDEVVRITEVRVGEAIKTNELAPAGIEGNTEINAFDFLCKQGCPKRELLYLLGMCENRGVAKASKMTS